MNLVRIDQSKDTVTIKASEKMIAGKCYQAQLTDSLLKDDADIKLEADIIKEKNAEITALKNKLAWFENKVKTLSATEWQEYNSL